MTIRERVGVGAAIFAAITLNTMGQKRINDASALTFADQRQRAEGEGWLFKSTAMALGTGAALAVLFDPIP